MHNLSLITELKTTSKISEVVSEKLRVVLRRIGKIIFLCESAKIT